MSLDQIIDKKKRELDAYESLLECLKNVAETCSDAMSAEQVSGGEREERGGREREREEREEREREGEEGGEGEKRERA